MNIVKKVEKHRFYAEGPGNAVCSQCPATYSTRVEGARSLSDCQCLSRRAAAQLGRAELLANFFGGAVWGNFRENSNCGDPPG